MTAPAHAPRAGYRQALLPGHQGLELENTATLLNAKLEGFNGHAALYECAPPLEGHKYVVASAVVTTYSGPETYLFPANGQGKITNWSELSGSYRGGLDHAQAFENAGYQAKLAA